MDKMTQRYFTEPISVSCLPIAVAVQGEGNKPVCRTIEWAAGGKYIFCEC